MKIEKNIPIPPNPRNRSAKYPFGKMEVGDSVFFEDGCARDYSTPAGKAAGAAHTFGRGNNLKFVARTVDGGVRIWRVE